MKWRVRKANIPPSHREISERYGEAVISTVVAGGFTPNTDDLSSRFRDRENNLNPETKAHARDWLTERGDLQERRHTIGLLSEFVAIDLIGIELLLAGWSLKEGRDEGDILKSVSTSISATAGILQNMQGTEQNELLALETSTQELVSKPDVSLQLSRRESAVGVKAKNASQLKAARQRSFRVIRMEPRRSKWRVVSIGQGHRTLRRCATRTDQRNVVADERLDRIRYRLMPLGIDFSCT